VNPFIIALTAVGPVLGAAGWFLSIPWLFWLGAAFAAVNLFMNLASGVMKLPLLPLLLIVIGAIFLDPWTRGAAAGLLVWTALESLGEVWASVRRPRRVA
jgi:hypothetical protein